MSREMSVCWGLQIFQVAQMGCDLFSKPIFSLNSEQCFFATCTWSCLLKNTHARTWSMMPEHKMHTSTPCYFHHGNHQFQISFLWITIYLWHKAYACLWANCSWSCKDLSLYCPDFMLSFLIMKEVGCLKLNSGHNKFGGADYVSVLNSKQGRLQETIVILSLVLILK